MRRVQDDKSAETAVAAERLISWECEARGITRRMARVIVAREAGIAPGSIENLLAGRLKVVEKIAGRLNALLVARIERQIGELEHELALARLAARRRHPVDIGRAEAALREARAALGRE